MREPLSFASFFQLLVERWRTFAVVGGVAALLAAVFSGPTFIKPRYRSSAIVYPVNLTSYSQETRSDQLLQLLESNSIRDSLIRLHRLPEHYGIDTTEPPGLTALVSHPKVVAVPHMGGQTVEAQVRAAGDISSEVLAALRGETLRWKVA